MNKIKKLQLSTQLIRTNKTQKKVLNDSDLQTIHTLLIYHSKSIAIHSMQIVEIISLSSILYVKAFSNYSTFYLEDGRKIVTSKTLKHWEEKIANDCFFRCHSSYLINSKHVKSYSISKNIISLKDIKLPISKSKKSELIKYFD